MDSTLCHILTQAIAFVCVDISYNKTILTFQKEFIGTLDEAMVRKIGH